MLGTEGSRLARVARVLRRIVGAPDYAAYLEHCRDRQHPPLAGGQHPARDAPIETSDVLDRSLRELEPPDQRRGLARRAVVLRARRLMMGRANASSR